MEQVEINHRNEAIALFVGWKRISLNEVFVYSFKSRVVKHPEEFPFHLNWDTLMPVVAKIIGTGGKNGTVELNQYALPSIDFVPRRQLNPFKNKSKPSFYFWFGDLSDYRKDSVMCDSMLQAYWMAVSDYCLAFHQQTVKA